MGKLYNNLPFPEEFKIILINKETESNMRTYLFLQLLKLYTNDPIIENNNK